MTLFERFTNLWTKDQDMQIATLTSANAEMHDLLNAEREKREATERELRPFQDYVDAADAMAARAAAEAAADRDAAVPPESGDGADG